MIKQIAALDTRILEALYAVRDLNLSYVFIGISELGGTFVVGGIVLALGVYFLLHKQFSTLTGLIVSIIGTATVAFSLKEILVRARPDVFYQAYAEDGFSFPSGHAAMSLALYGFLAYLAWKYLPKRSRGVVVFTTMLLVALIGLSRLYLGLHFLSDVVGGYAIAALFLALGIWVSERLNRNPLWS